MTNEATKKLLKAARENGYSEIRISLAAHSPFVKRSITAYYEKPDCITIDGISLMSGYIGMASDHYVSTEALTPGEYDLREDE